MNAKTSRLTLPPVAEMNEAQRVIYDQALRHFGAPIGPRIVFLETPELGLAWSALLSALEKSALPKRVWELAVLIVARDWTSQFEWWAHEKAALKAGVPVNVMEAIKADQRPTFNDALDRATYNYVTQLLRERRVSDATYAALHVAIGSRQLVELTVLVGHYSNVAMTLAAHAVQLPATAAPPLPEFW